MPTFVLAHYQQYKEDTAQLSAWLVKTAVSLGHAVNPLLPTESSENVDTRTAAQVRNAKKKARKKAKAKAMKDVDTEEGESATPTDPPEAAHDEPFTSGTSTSMLSSSPSRSMLGTYALKVGQFVQLATHLVDKKQKIPTEVVRVLRRCIRLRRRATEHFASFAHPSNNTHQHFVEILEQVLSILLSGEVTGYIKDEQQPVSTAPLNRFTHLSSDVEEGEDLSEIRVPGLSASEVSQVTIEDSFDDFMTAISAVIDFLELMQSTRQHLLIVWGKYSQRQIDLISAATITDTSIELLFDPLKDLIDRTGSCLCGDPDFMLFVVAIYLGVKPENRNGDTTLDLTHFDMVDDPQLAQVYDFALIPVVQILKSLALDIADPAKLCFDTGDSNHGTYDPNAIPTAAGFRDRWNQSRALLTESFTDVAFILGHGAIGQSRPFGGLFTDGDHGGNSFIIGQLLVRLQHFFQDRKWDFLLAIACQIFIDINFALGPETANAENQLRDSAGRMVAVLESSETALDRSAFEDPQSFAFKNRRALASFRAEAIRWRDFDLRSFAVQGSGLDVSGAHFIRRNPTLCGLIMSVLYFSYQAFGLGIADEGQLIIYIAHLDNACRLVSAPPPPVWQDMKNLIEFNDSNHIFSGPIPTTFDQAQSSILRMSGHSENKVKKWEHRGRAGAQPTFRRTDDKRYLHKTLQPTGRVLSIFRRRLFFEAGINIAYDVKDILKALSEMHRDRHRSDDNTGANGRKGKKKKKQSDSPKDLSSGHDETTRSSKLSVVQILSELELALASEVPSLRFDYLSMHLRCLRFLDSLDDATHKYIDRRLGGVRSSDNTRVIKIVSTAINFSTMSARGMSTRRLRRMQNPDHQDGLSDDFCLIKASELLRDLLSTDGEGDKETRLVGSGQSCM